MRKKITRSTNEAIGLQQSLGRGRSSIHFLNSLDHASSLILLITTDSEICLNIASNPALLSLS